MSRVPISLKLPPCLWMQKKWHDPNNKSTLVRDFFPYLEVSSYAFLYRSTCMIKWQRFRCSFEKHRVSLKTHDLGHKNLVLALSFFSLAISSENELLWRRTKRSDDHHAIIVTKGHSFRDLLPSWKWRRIPGAVL